MTPTLIGAIIGFIASGFARLFDMLNEFLDYRYQCGMLRLQSKLSRGGSSGKMEEAFVSRSRDPVARATEEAIADAQRDQRTLLKIASRGITDFTAAVRPGVTFTFLIIYFELVIAVQAGWLSIAEFTALWERPMEAMFAAVISFWFGSRALGRKTV